jgi:hypothetical protein
LRKENDEHAARDGSGKVIQPNRADRYLFEINPTGREWEIAGWLDQLFYPQQMMAGEAVGSHQIFDVRCEGQDLVVLFGMEQHFVAAFAADVDIEKPHMFKPRYATTLVRDGQSYRAMPSAAAFTGAIHDGTLAARVMVRTNFEETPKPQVHPLPPRGEGGPATKPAK